jgi:transposase
MMLRKMERASTTSAAVVRRTLSEKRRIVEETQQAGVSVRSVARTHGIRANQIFHWRKLYREGRLGDEAEVPDTSTLVAVRVVEDRQTPAKLKTGGKDQAQQLAIAPNGGMIQIESGKGRLWIEGSADPATLRIVLEQLLA